MLEYGLCSETFTSETWHINEDTVYHFTHIIGILKGDIPKNSYGFGRRENGLSWEAVLFTVCSTHDKLA